jgi:hypothetical protein
VRQHARRAWLGVIACAGLACSSTSSTRESLTTDTDSRSIPQPAARLEFLARYVKAKSPLADAEFTIRFQDNSRGTVPGPSDWDIRALMLTHGDADAWHAGWTPCATAAATEPSWVGELLRRHPNWSRGASSCYRNPGRAASMVFVFAGSALVALQDASEP